MIFGKHFSKYYLKYLIFFIFAIIALVAVDYAQLDIPNIVGQIIDGIEAGEKGLENAINKDQLLAFALRLCLIALIVFLGRICWRICIYGTGNKIAHDIRDEMYVHVEKMSTEFFEKNKTGSLMALFTNDVQTIREVYANGTLMLIDAIAMGSMSVIKMINLSPELTLICLIPLAFVCVFGVFMEKRITKKVTLNLEAFSDMTDYVEEDFTGINVIKAFAKEKRREFLFGKYNEKNKETSIAYVKEQVLVRVIINAILVISMLMIIFIGGIMIYEYKTYGKPTIFTTGKLVEFNTYFDSLIWPVIALGDLINLTGKAKAAKNRLSEFLNYEAEINDNLVKYPNITKKDILGNIRFNNLTFKYPLSNHDNLKNINLNIKQGEIIGLMGSTGCGKTAIVELLVRLYNLNPGQLFIDNYDIMELPIKTVRDAIAFVPQETFLFKNSIKENISFSTESVNMDDVINAAICSDINKDIKEFQDGYDTIVGERGVTVSGGQRQRIAIARALLKDSPILILDDSLSAVDTITESYILNHIKETRKGKTTIIIAHRITTLEHLDRIIVMKKGEIDSIGTHEELLKSCKAYQKEVSLQELEKEIGA